MPPDAPSPALGDAARGRWVPAAVGVPAPSRVPGVGSAGREGQPFPEAFCPSPRQGAGLAAYFIRIYHLVLPVSEDKREAVCRRRQPCRCR